MDTNGKVVKLLFLAGLILLCVLLPVVPLRGENSDSQTNPPAFMTNGTSDEGISSIVDSIETNAGSKEIAANNAEIAPPEEAEADREAKYNDVMKFIKKNSQLQQLLYLYRETLKVITKDELPILYELLDNDEYALYWNNVVKAIGFVSDDPDSVNVLLKFIRRNDNKKLELGGINTGFNIYSKNYAFAMMGLIGGDTADSVLRKRAYES